MGPIFGRLRAFDLIITFVTGQIAFDASSSYVIFGKGSIAGPASINSIVWIRWGYSFCRSHEETRSNRKGVFESLLRSFGSLLERERAIRDLLHTDEVRPL